MKTWKHVTQTQETGHWTYISVESLLVLTTPAYAPVDKGSFIITEPHITDKEVHISVIPAR